MVDSLTVKKIIEVPAVIRPPDDPIPGILIVDDSDDSREMLKILLEMWNYRVIEATDGIEALKIAEKDRPYLILMDVKLPKLDGFEAARRIRETEKIENVPIIFLSGCAEAVYQQQVKACGGNGYLTKPLDFEKLERILDKYIPRSEALSVYAASDVSESNQGFPHKSLP